jgi:hypothetical protein
MDFSLAPQGCSQFLVVSPYVGEIQKTSVDAFKARIGPAGLADIQRVLFLLELPSDDSVDNARSAIGTRNFHILHQNCETFVSWAKTGAGLSRQSAQILVKILDISIKATLACLALLIVFAFIKYGGIGKAIRIFFIEKLGLVIPPMLYPKFAVGAVGGVVAGVSMVNLAFGNAAYQPVTFNKTETS